MSKVTLFLTLIFFVVLALRFVFFTGSPPEITGEAVPYTPTHQDTLKFLVDNSDIIAVVEISSANDIGQQWFLDSSSVAQARILSLYFKNEQIPENESVITIIPEPASKPMGTSVVAMFLKNGKNLVFLKKIENHYKPITAHAVMSIMNNDNVLPIYKSTETEYKDGFSSGFSLEVVKQEILEYMNETGK